MSHHKKGIPRILRGSRAPVFQTGDAGAAPAIRLKRRHDIAGAFIFIQEVRYVSRLPAKFGYQYYR